MSKGTEKRCFNYMALLLLLSSVVLSTRCEAEPVKPELVLRGNTTIDGVLAIKWPNTSVEFTGKEIQKKFGLQEGDLKLKQNTHSITSGLPVIDWNCRCDDVYEKHRFHVATVINRNKMVISLRDSFTGKTIQKKVQLTHEMAPAINDVNTAFVLQKKALLIPGKGSIDLEQVLKGGAWTRSDVVLDGYNGVIEWQCQRPGPPVKPNHSSCYCSGSDIEIDNPECWSYRRDASVAFRTTAHNSIELFVFESNFSTADDEKIEEFLPNMMTEKNVTPKTRTLFLQP